MKLYLLKLWGAIPIPKRIRWTLVWLATQKFLVGVVGVILNHQGEILFFRHTYRGSQYPWGLPSGWLKPGEQPANAIVREIHEETGLNVRVLRPLLNDSTRNLRSVSLVYLCEIQGGTFRSSAEVAEMRFFNPLYLPEMVENQYDMILKILDTLQGEIHAPPRN